MGLAIHYRFHPELYSDTALENPTMAQELVAAATDFAAATLERIGHGVIPCEVIPFAAHSKRWSGGEASWHEGGIALGGPAQGSEWLSFGWSRIEPLPWSGERFIKTMFARDFVLTHRIICEVLSELEEAGIIGNIRDAAGFYRSGQSLAELRYVHARNMAFHRLVVDSL